MEQRAAEGEEEGELPDGARELGIVPFEEKRRAQHERTGEDEERGERLDVAEKASLEPHEVAAEQEIEKRCGEEVDVRRAEEEARSVRHSLQAGVDRGHVPPGRGEGDQSGDADYEVKDAQTHSYFFGRKRIALHTSSSATWRMP